MNASLEKGRSLSQEIRERVDLVALVRESGVSLTERGTSMVAVCPFCNTGRTGEHDFAFHVNVKRKFFHCFGCRESGGAIDFVMKRHGWTFRQAVSWLRERLLGSTERAGIL